MALWKSIKSGWMAFAHKLGKINTAILLSIVYFVTLGPISLGARVLIGDLLGIRAKEGESFASPPENVTVTMERAHKQF
ncbi:MAG: SxtJ family membrane protein [Deltaproteobacteria bacterium]|nr:SxtJ family membrane protein [Deltaproteobacteria bacterium]